MFGTNYGVASAPQLLAERAEAQRAAATGPESFNVLAPSLVAPGGLVEASLTMVGGGRVQGLSAELVWDATVVEPVAMSSGGAVEMQGGIVLSPKLGTIDAALLGAKQSGLTGDGVIATVTFRVLRAGDAGIRLERLITRDVANQPIAAESIRQQTLASMPSQTLLLAPWPNPAGGTATLSFALAQSGPVELSIYSVDGRRIRTLMTGTREAGMHRLSWSGDDDAHRAVTPGIYYARLSAGGRHFTRTLIHLR